VDKLTSLINCRLIGEDIVLRRGGGTLGVTVNGVVVSDRFLSLESGA
jgi:hypothetical protein